MNTIQPNTITVLVGPEQKDYSINRDLICTRSFFFDRCLQAHGFREGDEHIINFPEDDPLAFARLVHWLYEGKDGLHTFCNDHGDGGAAEASKTEHLRTIVSQLIDCYVLADKYLIRTFMNDLMDTIRAVFHRSLSFCSPELLQRVYEIGLRRCTLSWFLVKSIVYCMQHHPHLWMGSVSSSNGVKEEIQVEEDLLAELETDEEMMQDVMAETCHYLSMPYDDPAVVDGCLFHEHRAGEECGHG